MSSQQPFAPMMQVYGILESIVRHRLHCSTKDAVTRIRESFRQAMGYTRQYVVASPDDLQQIWHVVRTNQVLLDFAMEVATQLNVALAGSLMPFDKVIEALADGYGMHGHTERHGQVIDSNLQQRLPTKAAMEQLLRANGWYVVLLLIQHRSDMIYND